MKQEKDRETTEKRLLQAVGEIIEESGLEFLGVNTVAKRAGVSKMLIYRYFGSLEELIGQYILQQDYWVNLPTEIPERGELNPFIKALFLQQIAALRNDKLLIRLYRWELSTNNAIVEQIRKQREENGVKLVRFVSEISDIPYEEVQVIATLISSAITYLAMFGDSCEVYNGIRLQTDQGWKQLEDGINTLIDKWI